MLNKILEVLIEYKDIIIAGIAFTFWAISNVKEFKKRITDGMLKAKDLAKDQILRSGKEQQDWIVAHISTIVGKRFAIVLKFINEEALRKIVNSLYVKIMDKYDDNKINGSFEDESK